MKATSAKLKSSHESSRAVPSLDDGKGFRVPDAHIAPEVAREFKFVMPFVGNSWGDMELVELNEGLGRYFGMDTGLLVINAPNSEVFKLQDGDVIQSIDAAADIGRPCAANPRVVPGRRTTRASHHARQAPPDSQHRDAG